MRPLKSFQNITEFLKVQTPEFISRLRQKHGDSIFNLQILKETGSEVAAFHGLNCCRDGAKILQEMLSDSRFKYVEAQQGRHAFLYNSENSLIIDGAWKIFSYPAMDGILYQMLFSENFATRKATAFYTNNPKINPQAANELQNVLSTYDAIFYGSLTELQKQVERLNDLKQEAYNFPPLLDKAMREEVSLFWKFNEQNLQNEPKKTPQSNSAQLITTSTKSQII